MTDDVYSVIFRISEKLEIPVLILAIIALALVVVELGAFVVEVVFRFRRRFAVLEMTARRARLSLDAGDRPGALTSLTAVTWSRPMTRSLTVLVDAAGTVGGETRMAKELADFEFSRQSRLARTRMLVRLGPALGLMGTLIPLSPALDGLARGDVDTLTENLRIAFSITVLGIFIGGLAFALSLLREKFYGQDYSDLEYVAAILTSDESPEAEIDPVPEPPAPAAPEPEVAPTVIAPAGSGA